jgi:hypothetical protein
VQDIKLPRAAAKQSNHGNNLMIYVKTKNSKKLKIYSDGVVQNGLHSSDSYVRHARLMQVVGDGDVTGSNINEADEKQLILLLDTFVALFIAVAAPYKVKR